VFIVSYFIVGVCPGVLRTRVGYAGGTKHNPTYKSMGDYTESIQIDYDPSVTSFENILEIFWRSHSPDNKCKKQYQSAIFYHNDEQHTAAKKSKKEYERIHGSVATVIQKMGKFYLAEDYHQKFYLRKCEQLLFELNLDDIDIINAPIATRLNCYVAGKGTREEIMKDAKEFNISEKQLAKLVRNL
jgi:methionine-S-sulfoxide reductase